MLKNFGKAFMAFAIILTLILTSSLPIMAYTDDEVTVLLAEDFDTLYSAKTELLNNNLEESGWKTVHSGANGYFSQMKNWFANTYVRGDSTGKSGTGATIKGEDAPFVVNYNHNPSSTPYYNPVITRKINTTESGVGSAYTLPNEGVLSVSAKIKVPEGVSGLDFPSTAVIFAISGDDAVYKEANGGVAVGVPGNKAFYHALKLDASGNIVPHNFSLADFSLVPGVWHEITFLYDLSQTRAGVKNSCTIKVNTENEDEAKAWTNVILNSDAKELDAIYGISISMGQATVQSGGTLGNGTVYYDDFMVNILPPYAPFMPEFTVEGSTIDVNPEFVMAFSEDTTVNDEADLISAIASKLTLSDENGKKVSISCISEGETAVVKVNETLKYNSTYTFNCPEIPGYANGDYIPFSGFEHIFTTKFAKDVYVDADSIALSCGDDISSAESISASLDIINPNAQNGKYILGIFAYDQNAKIAGYNLEDVEVLEDIEIIPADVTEFAVSGAGYVALYLWNTDAETGALTELMHEPIIINPMEIELLKTNDKSSSFVMKTEDAINNIFVSMGQNPSVTGVNNYATFILLKEGTELKDIDDNNIMALSVVDLTTDGYYSTKFGADLEMGDYNLWAFGASWCNMPYSFGYVSTEDVERFLDNVKDGTIKTADLYTETMKYNNGIGVDENAFDTEKKQKNFNYRVDKKRLEITGETIEEKLTSFVEITDFAIKEVAFVEAVENSVYQGIEALLHENAYLMGTTEKKIGNVSNSISKKFVGKSFDSADEILEFLEEKRKEAKDDGKSSSGGRVGRTPSSSKGSSVSVAPVVTEPLKYEAPFTDMADYAWAKDAVSELTKRKIVSGIDTTTFAPGENVTREQFVKMLVIATQSYNDNATCSFEDVDENSWYYTYVASAKEAGLVNGISATEFGTAMPITRQDMAVMIYNALKVSYDGGEIQFADAESISDYAKNAVSYLTQNGYIYGKSDDTFAPVDLSTRAEAAVMIYRFIMK